MPWCPANIGTPGHCHDIVVRIRKVITLLAHIVLSFGIIAALWKGGPPVAKAIARRAGAF